MRTLKLLSASLFVLSIFTRTPDAHAAGPGAVGRAALLEQKGDYAAAERSSMPPRQVPTFKEALAADSEQSKC